MRRRYTVTIAYREPTFELYVGITPQIRYGSFEMVAERAAGASERALLEFPRIERCSWVGWLRDVQSISVVPSDAE